MTTTFPASLSRALVSRLGVFSEDRTQLAIHVTVSVRCNLFLSPFDDASLESHAAVETSMMVCLLSWSGADVQRQTSTLDERNIAQVALLERVSVDLEKIGEPRWSVRPFVKISDHRCLLPSVQRCSRIRFGLWASTWHFSTTTFPLGAFHDFGAISIVTNSTIVAVFFVAVFRCSRVLRQRVRRALATHERAQNMSSSSPPPFI